MDVSTLKMSDNDFRQFIVIRSQLKHSNIGFTIAGVFAYRLTTFVSPKSDCFRAAVYEHIPQGNRSTDEPSVVIQKNLNVYKQIASKAAENGANIMVFPEDGLIDPAFSRKIVATITEAIPDPRHGVYNPCDKPLDYKSSPITLTLSCLAKDNHMYVGADRIECNITSDPKCPKDGHYMYNTAVAFDPNGAIVAKYHKTHLFFEVEYNTPSEVEFIYFDTPFGRMGLYICFDVLFKNPGTQDVAKYGVQTMIFPTDWFDELPLRSAKQLQEGWSVANRVNLLAANVLEPQIGSVGSGIYAGQNGPIVYTDITTKTAKLLIADIPVDSRNPSASCLKPDHRFNKTISIETLKTDAKYQMAAKMYTKGHILKELTESEGSSVVCDSGFCCHLNYSLNSVDGLTGQSFWWFVGNTSSGHPISQIYPMCEEICGVFRCDDDRCESFPTSTSTVFKWLRLSATFSTNYTYPSLTTNDLALVPKQYWVYENRQQMNGSEVSLDLNNYDKPLLTMGNQSIDDPKIIIQKNLNVYKQIASKAAENPLDYKFSPITLTLSCLAKDNHIYVMADYGDRIECNITSDPKCPRDGHYMYNTAVAFDPNGAIVAKYHKTHLHLEKQYNTPTEAEFIYFDTSFGRIGLQICFDMLYKNPGTEDVAKYGVQTMLYPTYMGGGLSIYSTKQLHEGWSVTNRVNLLVANVLVPQFGVVASGIYSGQNGPIVYTNITSKTATLLIADIPVDSRNPSASCLKPGHRFTKTISIDSIKTDAEYETEGKLDTKYFSLKKLTASESSSVVCDSGFCCHLNYSIKSADGLKDESFWLFAGNSSRHPYPEVYPMCEEICGVFRCDGECESYPTRVTQQTVFTSIRLSATFSTNYTYPSLTTNDLALVPKQYWVYENRQQINGSEVSLDLHNYDKPLLAMHLYGRCFDRDPL
ncbi:unnamed protein product [Medioppia subpectinata]|uniref:CN hydrolase domain-containing protein n=1 Tax=Medioppia subpectinata TaxID=1979941 RepID=A0A7R9PV19_9ACAR|nr:unnamed protein product [Medioppia subpectinata]CAG2101831.1 unnamed protein product [Medioppia subpectinata]